MNNGSFSTGGQAQNPSFGTVVVTAALQLNAGAVFELYNTPDKITNYERLRADWLSNVAQIYTTPGGTGTYRALKIGYATAAGATTPAGYIHFANGTSYIAIVGAQTNAAGPLTQLSQYTQNASSGTQTAVSITPTYTQSGTAGYTALDVNPTESATGSGTKLLQRWAVGGTELARITNTGTLRTTGFTSLSFGINATLTGVADVVLERDAADTLALRHSTNAQTFRGYESYIDASNYSRWYQAFSGGFAYYGTQAAGAGTRRPLIVQHFTTTVAALPAAATAGAGSRAVVSDATAPAFGVAVVGGGAVVSPVYSDGANWIVG